jgi:hypothetical protein
MRSSWGRFGVLCFSLDRYCNKTRSVGIEVRASLLHSVQCGGQPRSSAIRVGGIPPRATPLKVDCISRRILMLNRTSAAIALYVCLLSTSSSKH